MPPIVLSFLIVLLSLIIAWQVHLKLTEQKRNLAARLKKNDFTGIEEILERTKDIGPQSWLEKKQYKLEQSGSGITLKKYFLTCLAFSVLSFALVMSFLESEFFSLLVAAMAFFVPEIQLSRRRAKNMENFNVILQNTLTRMSGMIRAGATIKQVVLEIARSPETPEIMRQEFKRVHTDIEYMYTPEEAFMRMYYRTRNEDIRIVSIIIEIQRKKGGNLAELLDSLQRTIAERNNQKRRIRALTASQTSQANFLTIIPFGAFGFFMLYNPAYYKDFLSTTHGVLTVFICFSMIGIGNFIMRKMVSVK